jgi:hypothetical protein
MNSGLLAPAKFHEAPLLPAIEKEAQPPQVPLQILGLRGRLQRTFAHAFLPGTGGIEVYQAGEDASEPTVEDTGKAVLLSLDLSPHFPGIFKRGRLKSVARYQIRHVSHDAPFGDWNYLLTLKTYVSPRDFGGIGTSNFRGLSEVE